MQPLSRQTLFTRSLSPQTTSPQIRLFGPGTRCALRQPQIAKRPSPTSLDLTRRASAMAQAKAIYTKDACPPAGPYSQAISTPTAIYVSGQLPALPSGTLPAGSIAYKTSLCIANLSRVLEAAGSSLGKVVKVTVFLTDMGDYGEMNGEYERHFRLSGGEGGGIKPARSCVAVKELPKGVEVEMECVALP